MVKYSVLKEDKQLFASKCKLYLPSEQELIEEIERDNFNVPNHGKLWKSLMTAYVGDYERLEGRLRQLSL